MGISFVLGLLEGLQRQHANNRMAGVRTFTSIAILGTVVGFMTRDYDNPFILPVFVLTLTALLLMANMVTLKKFKDPDVGQTSEVAALLMFAVAAYLVIGDRVIGIILGGTMALLLYVKEHLHDLSIA